MSKTKNTIISLLASSALLLSACSSNQAPVVNGQNNTNTAKVVPSGPAPTGFYRVQAGDNLYRIGLKFNQNTRTLSAWNNLSDPSQIEVGQLIRVSRATGSSGSGTTNTTKTPPNKGGSSSTAGNTGGGKANVSMRKPANGTVINNFNGNTNKGIQIAGNVGDPIFAASAGTVMYVGSGMRGYGNLIMIKHSNTTVTVYAYNQSMLVKYGDKVSAGQKIATMGTDGSGKPQLHFEVRVNSKAVNPGPYI